MKSGLPLIPDLFCHIITYGFFFMPFFLISSSLFLLPYFFFPISSFFLIALPDRFLYAVILSPLEEYGFP
jgi:hypothetical protein